MSGLSKTAFSVALLTIGLTAPIASAQEYRQENVVVTGSRIESLPGITLKRQGDFLLVDVRISSDSREYAMRTSEIEKTVDDLLAAAREKRDISVNVDAGGLIYPLLSSEGLPLSVGSRPDTSYTDLILRTPIPKNVGDIQPLVTKLETFANSIKGEGRATIDADDVPDVSVVNPDQYRMDVIDAILDEVDKVTKRLGPNYRVILTGLDKRMKSRNTDNINVTFYIPYSYTIVPTSMTTVLPEY
tara:strand:+ start:27396 stop:28127 length:732 start_codon:yes stop_codon:yes gene_type:complete